MILEALILANTASVENGMLNANGIGWRYFESPTGYPATLSGSVCGTMIVEDADYGTIRELTLTVGDDAGQVAPATGSLTFDCTEPSEQMTVGRLVFAWPFGIVVRGPTVVTASLSMGGDELGRQEFIARAPAGGD
jgi:hypothetical protein